jgi:AraC-like DNA-binding protein
MRVDLVPVPSVLLDRLAALGVDIERLLHTAGLARSRFQPPKARLTTSEFFAMWGALADLGGDPDIGLRLGSSALPHQYDVVSSAALHSATLGDALLKLARYKRLVCPEQVAIETHEDEARVRFEWLLARSSPPQQLIDATFAGTLTLARRGTQQPIMLERVELARAPGGTAHLNRYFGCEVRFDAAADVLVFPKVALAEPFVTYNSDLQAMLVSGLEAQLGADSKPSSLADDVRCALRRGMSGERPSIDKIAKNLGLSARTLQRRLEEAGTTYQRLLDEVRHESARRLLASTEVDTEEVAFLLGFEEYNSFTRAFQSWEGTTPKQWRGAERGR